MSEVCHACGQKITKLGGRLRKVQEPKYWPSSMTTEQIEKAIDDVCGCAGRYNCDCVSVFKRARADAWFRHNTTPDASERG